MAPRRSSSISSEGRGRRCHMPASLAAALIVRRGIGRRIPITATRLTPTGRRAGITPIHPATRDGPIMIATRSLLRHGGMLAALLAVPLIALAQAPAPTPSRPTAGAKTIGVPSTTKRVEALIVLNARGAKLSGQTLALEGTLPSAILFADRPSRRAGHIATTEVVDLWISGSFAKDPPNATVSAFRADGS